MGRVEFPNVTQRGLLDVLAGRNPEVIGTVGCAFENDLTRFSLINGQCHEVNAADAESRASPRWMVLAVQGGIP